MAVWQVKFESGAEAVVAAATAAINHDIDDRRSVHVRATGASNNK